jgi:hypothetical protein
MRIFIIFFCFITGCATSYKGPGPNLEVDLPPSTRGVARSKLLLG